MHRKPLGATGLDLPPIVLGTTSLGNLYRALPYPTKRALVAALLEHVPRPVCIDTAGKYGAGLALETLGRILRDLGVPPADVVVINKLGWLRVPLRTTAPTFEPGAWVDLDHDAELRLGGPGIVACHAQGCDLLGAPFRPDLVAVHDPDEYLAAARTAGERSARLAEVIDALTRLGELRDRGEFAAVGVGAKDWRVVRELDRRVSLDWVMLANSLTIYRHEAPLLEFVASLRARRVGVINAAVFHSGFVVGGAHFDYCSVDGLPDAAKLLAWRSRFRALCEDFSVTPAAVALRFGSEVPGVTAVAASVDTPSQLAELSRGVSEPIPAELWGEAKARGVIATDYPNVGNPAMPGS